MKCKIFYDEYIWDLEGKINDFLKNENVNVKFTNVIKSDNEKQNLSQVFIFYTEAENGYYSKNDDPIYIEDKEHENEK